MKRKTLVQLVAAALTATLAGTTVAAPVIVSSYDMSNGNSGAYNYWDDTYSGSGSRTTDGAALSGGKGDLTDGVVATDNWYVVEAPNGPGPYVGWTIDPTIHFHFAGVVNIQNISFSFDDSNGSGGVGAPASVVIGGTTYLVTDPSGSAPFQFDVGTLNLNVADLDITINRASNPWVFVSEIAFDGSRSLPEPNAFALFALALSGLAGTRIRARQRA
ncbi:MAG TPA: PEP-CTERM sorting domain-containing protein [Accumulibacter sp.]|nr:PEP-CTERM sorting domain-containing protein [Accumulibacter sp.]HPP46331.1 PEP-CTERM sorting domain-containing protein [Accumulibacter sp.]